MNSVSRPIVTSFNALAANEYHNYAVNIYDVVNSTYITVFHGKVFADANGHAEIRIDDILRDNLFKWGYSWNDNNQEWVPSRYITFGDTVLPVEDGTIFFLSNYSVVVAGGGSQSGTAWGGLDVSWQPVSLIESAAIVNLSLINDGIVPHIPPIATPHMWAALTIIVNGNNDTLKIGYSQADAVEIPIVGNGSFTVMQAFILSDLFTAFFGDDEIDGGDADDVQDDEIDGGYADDEGYSITGGLLSLYSGGATIPFAQIDVCASPYYVAWILPSGGWSCWGFDGNTTHDTQATVNSIRDNMDADVITGMEMQTKLTLYSGFVTKDEYNHLCTLNHAKEVYVYDTANDRSILCRVESRNNATAGNVRWQNTPFVLSLIEINRAII